MRKMLDGRVIIVMGVGPSMGRATALMCAEEGAAVALAARTRETLDSVAQEVGARTGTSIALPTDMNNAEDCKRLVAETVARFGRVDGLVSVGHRAEDNKTITECADDLSNWRPIMDTNFFGTLQVVKAVIAQMIRQKTGGSIVLINSMTAHLPWPGVLPYSSSKAALAAAARSLALEYGVHKIRVNGLHCGAILNDGLWNNLQFLAGQNGTTKEQEYGRIAALAPLGFIATPEEYMGSVLYLLSDLSKPVTGVSLHVNSGRYMA
jgi:NAD(P)-dependent dehydrogenase (short-subunit alcohol dehydrogenase family)